MVRSQIYKAHSCLKGKNILGRKVGAVVKALASHWCDVICHSVEALCGLSMFWVLILVLRGFSQGRDGSRGGARPPVIFGSNWGPKGGNIFGGRPPSHALSKGLDDHPPPPPPLFQGPDPALTGTPVLSTLSSKSNNLIFNSASNAYHYIVIYLFIKRKRKTGDKWTKTRKASYQRSWKEFFLWAPTMPIMPHRVP